jgi:hypothetical protein
MGGLSPRGLVAQAESAVETFGTQGGLGLRQFVHLLSYPPWCDLLAPEVQRAIGPLALQLHEAHEGRRP